MDRTDINDQLNKYPCTIDFIKHTGRQIGIKTGDARIDLIDSISDNAENVATLISVVGKSSPIQLGFITHKSYVRSTIVMLCKLGAMTISHVLSCIKFSSDPFGLTLNFSRELMTEENEEEFVTTLEMINPYYVNTCVGVSGSARLLTDYIMKGKHHYGFLERVTDDNRFDTIVKIMLTHPNYEGDVSKIYISLMTSILIHTYDSTSKNISGKLLRCLGITTNDILSVLPSEDAASKWIVCNYPNDV